MINKIAKYTPLLQHRNVYALAKFGNPRDRSNKKNPFFKNKEEPK